jgi:hypothetical protein
MARLVRMVAMHCAQPPSHTHGAQSRAVGHRWSASPQPPVHTQTGGLVPEAWTGEGDPLWQHGQDERVKRSKERRAMRHTCMPMVAIASLCLLASVLAAEAPHPDATLTVHTASSAVGVGPSGGRGMVTFQGQAYPCRIEGLAVGAGGSSRAAAIGKVYNLTHIEDVSGHYTAVSASAVLADSGDVATMRNPHGVVIDLIGISQEAKILLAVQGVTIALAGAPPARPRH